MVARSELSRACVNAETVPTVWLTHRYWSCSSVRGSCDAALEERDTDDLPPGGDITISPRLYETSCLVTDDECREGATFCDVPELEAGRYYRVLLEDEVVLDFTAGEESWTCSDL
jgi:hypothetical protein